MFKKFLSIFLVVFMMTVLMSCSSKNSSKMLPEYSKKEFGLSGFWAPYDISEQGLQQYKDAGFNTLAMINHSLAKDSENQFYLGSKRTMKALENCKKVGLKVILNYNDWIATWSENDLKYYSETPFSQFDLYGDYKDIITGVHIVDEPQPKHINRFKNEILINDFKKVYPNTDYIVNLIPKTAGSHNYGYDTYEELVDDYAQSIMSQFETPYISLDFYPFNTIAIEPDYHIISNYELIANTAKQYNAKKTMILQAATSGEFEENLSEGDMRWQVYTALAFGADNLQYYCYSMPKSFNEDGTVTHRYDKCILKPDDTPSELYHYVKETNNEIQSFASVILAYDWDETIGTSGTEEQTLRITDVEYDKDFNIKKFKNAKHFSKVTGTQDVIVSRFESEQYGEGYMFVNFAARNNSNTITASFKDCSAVAIYGSKGFDGTPKVVPLDDNGNITIELNYGDGVFVTPLK